MKSLLNVTFANYNKLVLPRRNYTHPLKVQARLVVPFIETLVWTDEFLQWNPADYGEISNIVLPSSLIWTPNLLIVNAKNNPFDASNEAQVVNILSDGTVLYTPTAAMEIPCQVTEVIEHVNISKFPFDHHSCGPQLSSWMYDNTSVEIVVPDEAIDLNNLAPNGQFVVTTGRVEKTEFDYGGRFFESQTFLLHLSRRPAYMSLTLLLPVCLISLLEGVSLVMSPEEPEKLSISITILLSFTVFLGVINENLPETSENISLMG
ncbi:Neuronal acetylcholine receptor subunit beta-3 [Bulinus truncatus]|nr:Neuronal acetylcholine receptor subunit beta-3 [Bulinus truncatus]